MKRLAYALAWFFDELDNLLDHCRGLGCRLGLATLSFKLSERYDIHLKRPKRCFWCREVFDGTE
jgi:hypothetical protein